MLEPYIAANSVTTTAMTSLWYSELIAWSVTAGISLQSSTHLDVSPLGVEKDVSVGHQQRWVHESLHRQLSMQPEPLLHLPRQHAYVP